MQNAIDLSMVESWLREAGDLALGARDSLSVSSKEDGSLVTEVDHQIESFLCEKIAHHFPGHRIVAEEGARHSGNDEYVWVIDPIDGTRAYASGLPVWGLSIGILRRGVPHAGLFYMPAVNELYKGTEESAFLNGRPLANPVPTDLQSKMAFIAVPSNAHRVFEISFRRLRSLGSTTAHLAYVARGTALAALSRKVYVWDIVPALPLLKATGISLRYLSGKEFEARSLLDGSISPEPLLAAPASVIDRVQALIRVKPQDDRL